MYSGTDIHRLKLKLLEGSSPSVKSKAEDSTRDQSCRRQLQSTSASGKTSKHRLTTSTARSCLVSNFMGCDYDDSNDEEDRTSVDLDESDDQGNDKLYYEKNPAWKIH